MSPRVFWRTTPRKFSALCQVHVDLNDPDKNKKTKQNSRGGVSQQPTAYVDQLSFM